MTVGRRKVLLIGLCVFVVSLLIRLIGIGWGLPNDLHEQSYHPDEPVIFGYSQRVEPAKGKFTPGFYNYGTLYLTLLRVSTDVASAYGAGPKDSSAKETWMAIGRFDLVGRVLSALAGAATVWIVFLILLPRAGMLGSLFGAAALSFAPGHVVHSRFQTVDVLATFFLVVSLYFALRLLPSGDDPLPDDRLYLRLAVLSGVFAGLSAGTKYTGIFALVALLVVVVLDRRTARWKALGLGVLAAVVVFFLATPGALLDSHAFLRDFRYEMTHTQTGHGAVFAGTPSGFIFNVWNLFVAMGMVMVVGGIAGLVRATLKRHAWAVALLAFSLAYYILIGRAEVKFMRYVFPLLPALAVGFGWLVSRAHIHPKAMVKAPLMFVCILGLGGLFGGGLAMTVRVTRWMVEPDPRDETALEIRNASSDSTSVGLATDPWFYTPPFYPQTAAGPWIESEPGSFERRYSWMQAATRPKVLRYVPADPRDRVDFDVRLLTEDKPDYVVLSSFEIGDYNRMKKLPSPPKGFEPQLGRAEEFMDTLRTEYDLVKVRGQQAAVPPSVFSGTVLPHDLAYIRPEVTVWKRKTDSQSPSNGSSTTSGSTGAPAATR